MSIRGGKKANRRSTAVSPEQQAHWLSARYRGPEHPVVQAYALPKLERIGRVLPLGECSVLDVGCGPGVFTQHLRRRARVVVGVDASPAMLARGQDGEAVVADAGCLPFADRSFDVVFEANVLHHVDDPQQTVREMARVARKAVVIIEPNRLNPIMFAFSLLVPAERGGLRSSRHYLVGLLTSTNLHVRHFWTTGMISQNNTPNFLLPLLRWFDKDFPFAEYHMAVAVPREGA